MVESFNLILLSGGHNLCRPDNWNKPTTNIDHCFKLYFPVAGSAEIRLNDTWHAIEPDQYYFISGFNLEQQQCSDLLDVYWIHFIPTSLELRYMLLQGPSLFAWPKDVNKCHHCALEILPALFEKPNAEVRHAADVCRVHAMLLHLIADYVRQNHIEFPLQNNKLFMRIKPSIDFMNKHILSPPRLPRSQPAPIWPLPISIECFVISSTPRR
ncbi:MAG: hypothetical protein HQ515_09235 [Phycisphaeraceae bacterium]|nr:hypothetical protein [Phycisphaeraceae bacterium]